MLCFRHMNKAWISIIGGIAVLFAMGAVQFFSARGTAPAVPAATRLQPIKNNSAASSGTNTSATSVSARAIPVLPSIAKGDRVASWDFAGAYADNPELAAKAEAEIQRLTGLIGKGTYPDASLYVGIANQYELLGDGKQEYDYLGRAITADVNATSGLPWHNLGVLMERLGALETARAAYERAARIQPQLKFYHYAYLEFLTARMKDDAADIEKEFAAATKYLGQDTDILSLYSAWKQS